MIILKNILKKLLKVIFKHLFICILIAYTPLPFFDILNFYNQEDPLNVVSDETDSDDKQDEDEENKNKLLKKIKIFLVIFGAIVMFYIIYKSNAEAGASVSNSGSTGVSKNANTDMSNLLKVQQDQIMQKRVDNALSTTRKILEIKKRV